MWTSLVTLPSPPPLFSSFIPNFRELGKLDGANYPLWKVKIRSHLVAWKLQWHVTNGNPNLTNCWIKMTGCYSRLTKMS